MKRMFVLILAFFIPFYSFSIAEDYSGYTTEYLLQMKKEITEELELRGYQETVAQNNSQCIIYENDHICIKMAEFQLQEGSVKTRIILNNYGNKYCLIMPDVTKKMYFEDEAFTTLKTLKTIGSGDFSLDIKPGETLEHEYIWSVGEAYDQAFLGFWFNKQIQLKTIKTDSTIDGFPKDTTIGFSFFLSDQKLDLTAVFSQEYEYEDFSESNAEIHDLQVSCSK